VPAKTGGWLRPIIAGTPRAHALAVAGGQAAKASNKRLRRILRYSGKVYHVSPKSIRVLLETMMSQQRYKEFLSTEFCELVVLHDAIFESKLASELYRDNNGKLRHRGDSAGYKGAFELKLRFMELALRFAKAIHPENYNSANQLQAIQINVDGKRVEVLPLDVAQPGTAQPAPSASNSPDPPRSDLPSSTASPPAASGEEKPPPPSSEVGAEAKKPKTEGDLYDTR